MKTPTLTSAARLGLLPCVLAFAHPLLHAQAKPAETPVDFARDIKPLLERSCVECHGPVKPKSGHRVDSREAIIKGGESQDAAVVPGHSDRSPLVHYIAGTVPDMEMPPLDKRDKYPALTAGEIALVRAWIDQGASWPEDLRLRSERTTPVAGGLAADTPAPTQHEIFARIRAGDTQAIAAAVQDRSVLEARDEAGNTPLIQAAFYLDAAQLEVLLELGADPNAANRAGATALMRAAADAAKLRALLKRGAKVNTQSAAGNTALIIACRGYGVAPAVKELLDHGADVNAVNRAGASALTAACEMGDEEVVRLLLTHGAKANATYRPQYSAAAESALMVAADAGHLGCVKLLLAHGADPHFASEYGTALHFAAKSHRLEIARLLLEHGVDVNLAARRVNSFRNDLGMTPLMYAATSETNDPTLVELLLKHGAKPDARNSVGETALALAQLRGETKVVAALRAAGASASAAAVPGAQSAPRFTADQIETIAPAVLREAAESGLAVLLQSSVRFNEATANRCITCHQHSLPSLTQELARDKRLAYDAAIAAILDTSTVKTAARRVEHALEETLPVPSIAAWLLLGLHAAGHPSDALTDGYVYSLARTQFGDGRWITKAARAPTDYSDVTSTALSLRALRVYAPPTMKGQFQSQIDRAANWLRGVRADSTEERAMQILGLHWAGAAPGELKTLSSELLEQQRDNGGWAQLSTLEADAYATGLTLYALHHGGGLSASDVAYQKGVRFLLSEQRSDGSWLVASRASPVQVAIENVFAHGKNQWISTTATGWSTMALILAAPSAAPTRVSQQ